MSYTARPPFTGGMSNQNQQQQQSGQSNNANLGAGGIPNMANMPLMNNAAAIPGNHLPNPSGSSPMSVLDQKVFQQQLMLQRQLLLQSQQYQQQQTSQQNQQAKFQQQQQPNQTQALNRLMSDMLNANDKNGSNVAQQSQHLQQFVQLQALSNIMQMQQAAQQQQQKSFQQQAVPLPTNTTITPVARQTTMQKPPVNYPRPNVQNKTTTSNVGSSPMQSRKSFPNAQKSTMPPMQSAMVAAPLNISGGSSKSTLPPQMPSAMTSATSSPKGYADIFAATLSNTQASMNITPSLTITKTNPPSSSAAPPSAKSNQSLANKPISSMATSQKSFLSEAISMSLGNVPIPVKGNTQPPSVSVMPTNKSTFSPTNKPIPVTPQKLNVPPNVPGLQKLSPTSPRTKQTPRKNTNPIRTTTQSLPVASVQSPPPLVVPQTVTKVTAPSAKPQPVAPAVATPATIATPSSVRVPPATPPKANVAAPTTSVAHAATPSKPVQAVANSNSITTAKVNVPIPKVEAVNKPSEPIQKSVKPEESKNATATKVKEQEKVVPIKAEKVNEAVKSEKSDALSSSAQPSTAAKKQTESKSKQNTSQNSAAVTGKSQSTSLEKNEKKKEETTATAKQSSDPITKTPAVAKAARVANASIPTPSSIDARVKRNRFKTIPYQSPTPEIELVSKISANEAINAHKKKVDDDKLTLFYKNEFLAVRNAEGGFFLCQTMYNVYKSSPKLRIRWLSEDATKKNQYSLDFYDSTDIECVLTSVSLNKLGKGKFELTNAELDRIKNILKKALDVEKGIVNRLDVTEENPDGLDLSLYKDESQIEKKGSGKRKAKETAHSGKSSPVAKKRKVSAAKDRGTPIARAVKSTAGGSKASNAASKSTKKSPAKKTPLSPKKATAVKTSDTEEVKSTPVTKRAAAKRKLVDETTEQQTKEADSKKVKGAEASKDGESGEVASRPDDKSPKQSSAKSSESATASTTEKAEPSAGRPTRRNK